MPRSQLSEFDKGRILALHEDGYCIRAISRALGFSKSTVHLWVKRNANEGHVTCRRRSGRPRATTEDEDKNILRCIDEAPDRTVKEIKNILQLPLSRTTISRRLRKHPRTQNNETFLQLENQNRTTDMVEPVYSVDMSVPDAKGNCQHWKAVVSGEDNSATASDKKVANGHCWWPEGPQGSYQTVLHGSMDDNKESETLFPTEKCDMNATRQPGPVERGSEESRGQQDPLAMCSQWEIETVAQTLTENGAAVNCKDIAGKTPLHVAIENQHDGLISLLLCHPGLDLTVKDNAGLTPFAAAVASRNNKAAQGILDRMPAAAEQYDDEGHNLLHTAIQKEDMESVLFLLSIHMDVNSRVQDSSQTPALHLAAATGSEVLVRSLVLAGASVDDRGTHQRTALLVAAEGGHVGVVSALLQNGADADASDSEGNNALHIACREGQLGTACVLLTESQLDAEAENLKGRNPLHELARAPQNTAARIAELFIECLPNYPLNKTDLDGNTALLLAYMNGNRDLCHTLVRSGANLGAMNKDGITIFDYHLATNQLLHSLLDNLSREPPWTEGDICLECGISFGSTIHKHHCHHCGRILCSKCSDKEAPILKFGLNKPVRVCSVCFNVLQGPSESQR